VGEGKLSVPNTLSILRVALIPVIIIFLALSDEIYHLLAGICFLLAAITDMLDGLIARRYNSVTALGKLLDPLADKLLVSMVLIMLCSMGRAPGWMVAIIVGREILVTGLRGVSLERGRLMPALWSGKIKAIVQYASITCLCISREIFGVPFGSLGHILLWIALFITIYSGLRLFWESFSGSY
jgi:CDP-diacylglycerol--glycerol-3-phosphate 3-phosphatidyltransferase